MDHIGALPYFTEYTGFKGRVFMTHPTKAIFKYIMLDSLKLNANEKTLFSKTDLFKCIDKIECVNFHETINCDGIKFTAYNAGHVIGACMFLINISGIKVLYTGDYSLEKDLHINPAEIPDEKIDVLIVESTYGVKTHEKREEREVIL